MIAGIGVVKLADRFAPQTLIVAGLAFVSIGFASILLFRHDLSMAAVIISFVVLELGVGMSQTVSNDTIVASVPSAKAGAASAVSETAYELGAVVGTATLGTIFSAFYRANVTVPGGLSPSQAKDAAESIAGATSVARTLPDPAGASCWSLPGWRSIPGSRPPPPSLRRSPSSPGSSSPSPSAATRCRPVSGSVARRATAPNPATAPRCARGSTWSTGSGRPAIRGRRRPARPTGSTASSRLFNGTFSQSQRRSRSRSCRHLPSTRFRAVTLGRRKSDRPMWAQKRSAEPLSIPGPARKDEIAGQMPYYADFLPLVHDEMLSAARARDAGRRRAGERRRRGRRAADRHEAAVLLRRGL